MYKFIKNILKHLTKEPSDLTIIEVTPKDIIIKNMTTEKIAEHVYTWALKRIDFLSNNCINDQNFKDSMAIASEFEEWIDAKELGVDEIDIMVLENIDF